MIRKKISIVFAVVFVLSLMLSVCTLAYPTGDDYPEDLKNAEKDALIDPWRFYNRECTSFVAWCLNSRNGVNFNNFYPDGETQWSDAKNWGPVAESLGITVDQKPEIGSVAWWDNGYYGHVAWVSEVNGDHVTVEEYNMGSRGTFHTRTISVNDPAGFIHIKDLSSMNKDIGWDYDGTDWRYLDPKGDPVTGWLKYKNHWYYLDPESGVMLTGWQEVNHNWYYLEPDSGEMRTGWLLYKEHWYYFSNSGAMATGWIYADEDWYYFDPAYGGMKTGWLFDREYWYYLSTSGEMATGWIDVRDSSYYMDPVSGKMQTEWKRIDGKWYYFLSSGEMATGWILDQEKWFFLDDKGIMQTGWQEVKKTWYFLKKNGEMAEKEWWDGYWLSKGGAWLYKPKASWKKDETGWWFGDTSGWYAKDSKEIINGVSYEFDANGYWKEKNQ